MSRPQLRLIGDVHGNWGQYVSLASKAHRSIQLGDLDFDYRWLPKCLSPVDHRVLGGNHDNYLSQGGVFVEQPAHFLSDYGVHAVPDVGEFFYVRGGCSIDRAQRTEGVDWFPEEELSYRQCLAALSLYEQVKPSYVLSHECPARLIAHISSKQFWDGERLRPSSTAQLLDQMLDTHAPLLWVFGHHHRDWTACLGRTRFQCLGILSCFDFPQDLAVKKGDTDAPDNFAFG